MTRTCLPLLLTLAACLAGCPERHKGAERPPDVAVVHGRPIPLEELQSELAFLRRTSGGVLPQTDAEQLALRRATLEDLVDRMLVLDAAQQEGLTVSAEKVDRELLRLKAEYHGPGFDEALSEGMLSLQELRERTRARLVMERYFVDEVFARVVVTDAEIEAWYKDHPEDFTQPEQVRAAQIVVKTPEEARRIAAKVRDGMTFEEAARRWSLTPDAKLGGDLGFFKKGVMPPAFDQACFALGVRQVSDVVASDYGFHLFKLLDRRPAEARSLQKARGEIERLLLQKKREEAQRRAVLELRAGPRAAACKAARGEGDAGTTDEAVTACLTQAASELVKVNEAVLERPQQ